MMKQRPILHYPEPPDKEKMSPEEYARQLRTWSERWATEERAFNAAYVKLLRFAAVQIMSQPGWWMVGQEGQALVDAMDMVLDAMTDEQVKLFDHETAQGN